MFGLKRWQKVVKRLWSCPICVESPKWSTGPITPPPPKGGGHLWTVFLKNQKIKHFVWKHRIYSRHAKMGGFCIKICRFMSFIVHFCPKMGPQGLDKFWGRPPKGPQWRFISASPYPWPPRGGLRQIWSKFHNYAEIPARDSRLYKKWPKTTFFGAHFCQCYVYPVYFWSKIWPKIVRKFLTRKCQSKWIPECWSTFVSHLPPGGIDVKWAKKIQFHGNSIISSWFVQKKMA